MRTTFCVMLCSPMPHGLSATFIKPCRADVTIVSMVCQCVRKTPPEKWSTKSWRPAPEAENVMRLARAEARTPSKPHFFLLYQHGRRGLQGLLRESIFRNRSETISLHLSGRKELVVMMQTFVFPGHVTIFSPRVCPFKVFALPVLLSPQG